MKATTYQTHNNLPSTLAVVISVGRHSWIFMTLTENKTYKKCKSCSDAGSSKPKSFASSAAPQRKVWAGSCTVGHFEKAILEESLESPLLEENLISSIILKFATTTTGDMWRIPAVFELQKL